jgi:hypothetical protein
MRFVAIALTAVLIVVTIAAIVGGFALLARRLLGMRFGLGTLRRRGRHRRVHGAEVGDRAERHPPVPVLTHPPRMVWR